MKKLSVFLKRKVSYSINIDFGLIKNLDSCLPLKRKDHVIIITNQYLKSMYLNCIQNQLKKLNIYFDNIVIPNGEKSKSITTINKIFSELIVKGYTKYSVIIAFGGGVIGDLSGFIASVYQRGMRLIHIPTTLLSQIDSSIGGKNAINHPLGKNVIGTFYQPISVIIDLNFLYTLPKCELSSGMAEAIKYGIILDAKFFFWIKKNINLIMQLNKYALFYCVYKCCEIKSKIVSIKEKDSYRRMLLNFGHTYGHAIESYMKYKNWSHGRSISAGMMMASYVSYKLKKLSKKEINLIKELLIRINLPVSGPEEMKPSSYIFYMKRDKKSHQGKIKIVLPKKIGMGEIQSNIKESLIIESILQNF